MNSILVNFPKTAFDISVRGTLIIEKAAGGNAARGKSKRCNQIEESFHTLIINTMNEMAVNLASIFMP